MVNIPLSKSIWPLISGWDEVGGACQRGRLCTEWRRKVAQALPRCTIRSRRWCSSLDSSRAGAASSAARLPMLRVSHCQTAELGSLGGGNGGGGLAITWAGAAAPCGSPAGGGRSGGGGGLAAAASPSCCRWWRCCWSWLAARTAAPGMAGMAGMAGGDGVLSLSAPPRAQRSEAAANTPGPQPQLHSLYTEHCHDRLASWPIGRAHKTPKYTYAKGYLPSNSSVWSRLINNYLH